jgi:hypothetical protein
MFLHFRKALCKAEKKGLRWWGGVSLYMHCNLLLLLPTSTKHYRRKKKKVCEEQSCSLAHWSSNVTTQLHLCRLTQTQHGTHFILSLGGKMSLSLIVTLFFFYHHVSNVTLHMGQTLVALLKILLHAIWENGSLDVANFQHQTEATVSRV